MTDTRLPKPVTSASRSSWVAASGLLAGCAITLVGVGLQLSPELILVRAVIGGALMAAIAASISAGWKILQLSDED